MDLTGTAAIISGGASGLGEATARALAAGGSTVVIADLNADRGEAVAAEIGGKFVQTDVVDEASITTAVDVAAGLGSPLRVIVNCAGIGWAERTVNRDGSPHSFATFRKVIDINLIGTFNLMRIGAAAVAPHRAGRRRRPARRGHQHRFGGRPRRADRPARLLGLQGRDHRHDRARRP